MKTIRIIRLILASPSLLAIGAIVLWVNVKGELAAWGRHYLETGESGL